MAGSRQDPAAPGAQVLRIGGGKAVAVVPADPEKGLQPQRSGTAAEAGPVMAGYAQGLLDGVQRVDALKFGAARGGGAEDELSIAADDLVELQYADGVVLWTTGRLLQQDLAQPADGSALRRGTAGDGAALQAADLGQLRSAVSRRGGGSGLQGLVRYKMAGAARDAFARLEQDKAGVEGLYKVLSDLRPKQGAAASSATAAPPGLGAQVARLEAAGGKPQLLLLHGTFSSFHGSYQALDAVAPGADAAITPLSRLHSLYQGRVYAYEHATATRSVLENLARLAAALGENLVLDVISYSRGGLLAELLARGELKSPFELRDAQLVASCVLGRSEVVAALPQRERLREQLDQAVATWWSSVRREPLPVPAPGAKPAVAALQARLKAVVNDVAGRAELFDSALDTAACELYWLALAQQELLRAQPRLRRQVRVAAPVSGTSLADGRLDKWLSGLINLLLKVAEKKTLAASGGLVTPLLKPLFALLGWLAEESVDVENLRGLASMRTGNAETLLATAQHLRLDQHADARLLVISSDFVSGDGWAGILQSGLDWLSERFFGGPNDLVVNTQAMSAGLARREGSVTLRHFCRDGLIHINYFRFNEVCDALLYELSSEREATTAARGERRRGASGADPRLGRVIVIPGIGGSELAVDGRKLWLDYQALALEDGLAELAERRVSAARREKVSAERVSAAYRPLLDHLAYAGFEVEPFPYDWSHDLHHAGEALEQRVAELKDAGVPLHFVAHSSGGLVLRALAGRNPSLWRELMNRPGRALMLGTPNHGSWAIAELLAGNSRVVRSLARLNPWQDADSVRLSFARMTGVLQLLPRLDPSQRYAGLDLVQPDRVIDAQMRRSNLADHVSFQRHVAYIAGQACSTPDGTPAGSADGDGRVLWSDGPLPEQAVRYAAGVSHGNLISDKTVLNEIASYLREGTWPRLGTAKPPPLSAARDSSDPQGRKLAIDTLPPPEDLVGALLGASRANETDGRADAGAGGRLAITTSHGNLVHAIYPVMLGHYQGDGLYSTERTLDERLEGRLSESLRLRLYPGAVGTAQVFLDDSRRPTGAAVIGLGEIGELSPGKVRQSFSRGIRELSQSLFQQLTGADYSQGFDVYTVLIGSTGESLSIAESVDSIIRGALDANAEIDRGNERRNPRQLRAYPRLGRLHFIELWADRAHSMRSELRKLAACEEFLHKLELKPGLIADRGRQKRLFAQEDMAWWRRLLIQCDSRGYLRFKALTDRARMMSLVRPTQSNLVSLLMEQMTLSGANDPRLGRTLHELLIPNEFKERQADDRPVVFVLDAKSAAYPWELLIDPKAPDGVARSVRQGVVRQLKTSSFTDQPLADLRSILIVGDTDSGLAALPGAIAEANTVAEAFRNASGWPEPTLLSRPTAGDLLKELFGQPWRVLHFAAHGVHNHVDPVCAQCGSKSGPGKHCPVVSCNPRRHCANAPRSGMVLGPGLYLTPVEISQMRSVPEFVFLNCCFLARSDGEQMVSGLSRLGANLATQLIQMGVRAVIAAGWAVNDDAAKVFARTLYDALLGGATFGEATRAARAACLRLHPNDNTWGAYQCYGDPAWRLDVNGRKPPGVGDWNADPRAAYAEFYNLQRRGEACRIAELERERERYAKLVQEMEGREADWLRRADIAGARARAALALALDDLVDECLADAARGNAVNTAILLRTRVECEVRQTLGECLGAAPSPDNVENNSVSPARRQALEKRLGSLIRMLKRSAPVAGDDDESPGHVERRRMILRLRFARAWINGGADEACLRRLERSARKFADSHGSIQVEDRVQDGLRDLRCNNARLYQLGAGLLRALRQPDDGTREAALNRIKAEIQKGLNDVRERAEDRNDYRFIAHFASLRILSAIAQDNLDEVRPGPRGRSEAMGILDEIGATLDRGVPHVQLQRSIDWVAFMRDLHPDATMRETLHTLYENAYRRLDRRGEARLLIWRSRRGEVEAKADPEAEPKPKLKLRLNLKVESSSKPKSKPVAQSQSKPEPQPAAELTSELESKPGPELESGIELEAEIGPSSPSMSVTAQTGEHATVSSDQEAQTDAEHAASVPPSASRSASAKKAPKPKRPR